LVCAFDIFDGDAADAFAVVVGEEVLAGEVFSEGCVFGDGDGFGAGAAEGVGDDDGGWGAVFVVGV
jgi:hypothetical protein